MPLCWKSSVSAPITKSGEEQRRHSPGLRRKLPTLPQPASTARGLVPRLGLRVIEPVSRVPSRLLKPQGAGPFRGAACHRWPAAAETRTWGRVRGAGTRPPASSGWGVPGAGARGSPEQGYKNAARAQESSLDGVAALQPCREASSSCSSATVRPPACRLMLPATRLGGLAYASLSLPFLLQPAAWRQRWRCGR